MRKTRKGKGISVQAFRQIALTCMLLSLSLELVATVGAEGDAEILIADFFSCDKFGTPYHYFPMKTNVYFRLDLANRGPTENITIDLSVLDVTSVPIGFAQLSTTIAQNASELYTIHVFIPKWARLGVATAFVSVFARGKLVDSACTQFYIGPEDHTPPVVSLLSPETTTYESSSIPLIFTINERSLWMGYSLDTQANVSLEGNTTLHALSNGDYNLVVFANDTSGNIGFAQVNFTIVIVHDVAIIDLQCHVSEVHTGQPVEISISVQNQGTAPETFNMSIYANTETLETLKVINLPAGYEAIIPFTWDTTGWARGNYTVWSTAHPVSGETDATDNTCLGSALSMVTRPDIAITSLAFAKKTIGQGFTAKIEVTVRNQGDRLETFNVTVHANSTLILAETVALIGSNSTIIAFCWDTTGFAKGNYSLTAIARPLPDEVATADNTVTNDGIFITIPGDVDGDRDIDIFDIVIISRLYGAAQPDDPRYNPDCDVDGDGRIGIYDVAVAAGHYGDSW